MVWPRSANFLLLTLSCFLTGVDRNRKRGKIFRLLEDEWYEQIAKKRDLIPSCRGLGFYFLYLIQLYWIRLGMIILLTMIIFQNSWYQVKGLACRTFDTSTPKLQTPWKEGIATMILILQVRKPILCNTKHRVNLPKVTLPDAHIRNTWETPSKNEIARGREVQSWGSGVSCLGPQSPHLESGGDDDDVTSISKDSLN